MRLAVLLALLISLPVIGSSTSEPTVANPYDSIPVIEPAAPYTMLLTVFPTPESAQRAARDLSGMPAVRIERRPEGYAVLFGEYATVEIAQLEYQRLRLEEGFLIDRVERRTPLGYFVALEGFHSKDEAAELLATLIQEGFSGAECSGVEDRWAVTWSVPDAAEAERLQVALIHAGFPVNVIRPNDVPLAAEACEDTTTEGSQTIVSPEQNAKQIAALMVAGSF